MSSIRVNANAVILKDNKILLIKFEDHSGVHYNLPGGGVDLGESVPVALARECQEEACADVEVKDLILCWQYMPELENNRFGTRQKVGFIFRCELKVGSNPEMPKIPDANQIGVEWVPLEELLSARATVPPLYPKLGKQLYDSITQNQKIEFLKTTPF